VQAEGFSLKSSFDDGKAPSAHITHSTQYFAMFGHRSLYHDGWRAVCPWPGQSFTESGLTFGAPIDYDKLIELDAKGWELYNLNEDFAETNNLAEKERARLIAMIGMWYVEAGKYDVLPIGSRGVQRLAEERPEIAVGRKKYVYYAGTATGAQQRRAAAGQRPATGVRARQCAQRRRRGRAVLDGRR
jgi:arylsulfatase